MLANLMNDNQHRTGHQEFTGIQYSLFGEGNGTPLQYSCLENPMEGGAW